VGIVFGVPSLRIKGFYLAIVTLAAQFFLIWMFTQNPWWTNYSAAGVITAPPRALFGDFYVTGIQATPVNKYLFLLCFTALLALVAKNLVRSAIGRSWMAIRDMDIAAEIIGIRPLAAKLSAFAVSSFFIGIAGALWAFIYTASVEALAFEVSRSFQVLFMILIGGLGSILGSFLGAAFIVLLPIMLSNLPAMIGLSMPVDLIAHLEDLYARTDLPRDTILARREVLFQNARDRFRAEIQPAFRSYTFGSFLTTPLNNATLIARRLYYDRLHLFDAAFERHGRDLPATIRAVVAAAEAARDDPYGALDRLAAP